MDWQDTTEQTMLKPEELPPPHTLIDGPGGPIALMFWYLPAEVSWDDAAAEQGYDISSAEMPEDHPLHERASDGEDVLADWNPEIPDGWTLGGKLDGEDGPVAVFIRPTPLKGQTNV